MAQRDGKGTMGAESRFVNARSFDSGVALAQDENSSLLVRGNVQRENAKRETL